MLGNIYDFLFATDWTLLNPKSTFKFAGKIMGWDVFVVENTKQSRKY